MLLELKIENFGIIEDVRMRLGSGLNVITGETGSGKSLILQAIDVVMGSRTTAGMVRNGARRSVIEALFDLNHRAEIQNWLLENGFNSSDSFLSIRREIPLEGRGRVYINNLPTRLSILKSLASQLLELHGQNEHQRLLDTENHLESIDIFAGVRELRDQVSDLYHRSFSIRKRLKTVSLAQGERDRRLDFIKYSLEEIESFEPQNGEFDDLINEQALIQNSGKMFSDVNCSYSTLREEEGSILDRLAQIEATLERHAHLHTGLESNLDYLREARYSLEGVADFLRQEKEQLQFSPERMEDIEERVAGYRRLHKKYGGTTEGVVNMQSELLKELTLIESSDEEAELLQSELTVVDQELCQVAEELSRRRRAVIPGLEKELKKELVELGMPGAELKVSVKRELNSSDFSEGGDSENSSSAATASRVQKYQINERGLDRVEFLLRANAGESLLPLRKIASGGEMSRIMLALKSILIEQRPVATVIFDEIDTGVGGEVAHAIAERLLVHTRNAQVLVVTHLHQIAGHGAHHFYISKEVRSGRTLTSIRRLQGEERLHELARMLGGNSPGAVVLEHARELLAQTVG